MEIKDFNYCDTDIIDKFIRVKKKDVDEFEENSLKLMDIDMMQGISAVAGFMKGDRNTAIQSYLFTKDQWTLESASEWVYRADETGEITHKDDSGKEIIQEIAVLLGELESSMREQLKLAAEDEAESKDFADLRTLDGVEIFAVGTHNGDKYTLDDLKEIEKNFEPLKQRLQPYVKLGHNSKQALLANDGLPAAGWLERVYVVGEKLIADIVDIPEKIYQLIQNKAFKRISSEIYFNLKGQDGKIFPKSLKSIAILGADTPAVGTLDDILSLYTSKHCPTQETAEIREVEYSIGKNNLEEDETMEKEELQSKIAELTNKNAQLTSEKETAEKKFSDEKEAKETVEKDFSALKQASREKEIESKVDSLIENNKILPAQKELATALYAQQDQIKQYSKEDNPIDVVTEFFELSQYAVDVKENTSAVSPKNESEKEKAKATAIKDAPSLKDAVAAYTAQEGE
jgi:hypothetical protein